MATSTYLIQSMPFFLQKDVSDPPLIYYSASDFRRMMGALMPRPGVHGSYDFWVQQADSVGFSIKVRAGYARVGTTVANYLVSMSADTTIALTGFNTNPTSTRAHKVFLVVYDKLLQGTGYGAELVVSEDIGTGVPPPGNCAAYLELATIIFEPKQSNVQNKDITNVAAHTGPGEWITLSGAVSSTYEDAFLATGTGNLRAIFGNGIVRLSGSIHRTDGKPFAASSAQTVATLPVRLRPKGSRYLVCATSDGTYTCRARIQPDGTITVQIPDADSNAPAIARSDPSYVYFDGVTYELDV